MPAWILAALVVIPAAAFMPARAIATLPVIVSAIVASEVVVAEEAPAARRASRGSPRGGTPREVRTFTANDLLGEPTQCDYGKKKGNTSISHNDDDEKQTLRAHISAGDCDLTIRMIGKVRFASDLSDVESGPGRRLVHPERERRADDPPGRDPFRRRRPHDEEVHG